MLQVEHLHKGYDTVLALDDVSFNVERGQIFGLIGPNGAGKTTTIRIILNILQADTGRVLYDGKPFTPAIHDTVGYLPEERGLYKKSKLLDTILYFAELRGMSRPKARAEALRWLERLGMKEHAARPTQELSKGNQQKIQFICSVLHNPSLVVLDEPFSGLDPVNQETFKDIFLQLKQEGKAVIYSTHQMDQAERLSDTLCLINRGKSVLAGTVRDVKRRYGTNTLAVEFEGDPAVLESLPGVVRARTYRNAAELELSEQVDLRALIGLVNSRVAVRKVELREPSLQSIFLSAVGQSPVQTGEVAA